MKKATLLNVAQLISAHQKIGLMEKISPIKLYTKVKKSIEKTQISVII